MYWAIRIYQLPCPEFMTQGVGTLRGATHGRIHEIPPANSCIWRLAARCGMSRDCKSTAYPFARWHHCWLAPGGQTTLSPASSPKIIQNGKQFLH